MPKKKKSVNWRAQEPSLKNQVVKIGLSLLELKETLRAEFQKFNQKTHENFAEVRRDIAELKEMTSERPTRQELHHILNKELNKAAEMTLPRLDETDEKLQDHENRIAKLETIST